jgi:hypothetical protein
VLHPRRTTGRILSLPAARERRLNWPRSRTVLGRRLRNTCAARYAPGLRAQLAASRPAPLPVESGTHRPSRMDQGGVFHLAQSSAVGDRLRGQAHRGGITGPLDRQEVRIKHSEHLCCSTYPATPVGLTLTGRCRSQGRRGVHHMDVLPFHGRIISGVRPVRDSHGIDHSLC